MKKYLSIVLAVCMLSSLTSCSDSSSATSKKSIVSVETSDSEKTTKELKKEKNKDSNKETTSKPSKNTVETEPATEKETEITTETSTNSSDNFTIDEQVLWEFDGVKVIAKEIEIDKRWGTTIKVYAENNSNKNISISCNQAIVNDYMISSFGLIELTAGNKANDEIELSTSDLKAAGIDNIGKIELYLQTYDPETYETLDESGCITIKTSDYASVDSENNIEGITLLDKDGVKVIAKYVDENSIWGASVLMYIENNTDKNLIINGDDFAVNGFMVSADYYENVYAGKKCISPLDIYNTSLKENNIESIDQVELTLHVLTDDDTYTHLTDTDKITIKTK